MFPSFFQALHKEGLPVSLREYLALLGAMRAGVADYNVEQFYYLARAALVKDERNFDRFDRVFGAIFHGEENLVAIIQMMFDQLPPEWLKQLAEQLLSEEEMRDAEAQGEGGIKAAVERKLREMAAREQRRQGRGKGGRGTGDDPEGERDGEHEGEPGQRAQRVWEQRAYRNLDGDVELGTRNLKVALRRLRRFARDGAETELDLPGTIRATARQAGLLDVLMQPERRNKVKVLLLTDIGGSMAGYVQLTAELFSAARSEFKNLAHFYFHNCPYETLWHDNRRRKDAGTETSRIIQTYPRDWKLIFVGDAAMAPYELTQPGGSVEHFNAEPGKLWLERLCGHFKSAAWLNPTPEDEWRYTSSIAMVQKAMRERMYPLTPSGIDKASRELSR